MYKQQKQQTTIYAVITILGIIMSLCLMSTKWLKWDISAIDAGNGPYKIEIISPTLQISHALYEKDFTNEVIQVTSSKGKCWRGQIKLDISSRDRLIEEWALRLLNLVLAISILVAGLSGLQIIWMYRESYYIKFALGLCTLITVISIIRALLTPRIINEPDLSNFDCVYSLVIKATLQSVNLETVVLLIVSILLASLLIYLTLRNWIVSRYSKSSQIY